MPGHHKEDPVTCPNCSFPATHNYCAQCGQETHLHRDTFWGLIRHFAGHYFHYDSKFWKTIKALWFAPGKLTKEYWEGKRARSIAPVSLYIFISAVFFIATFSLNPGRGAGEEERHPAELAQLRQQQATRDSTAAARPSVIKSYKKSFRDKLLKIEYQSDSHLEEQISERFSHNLPKLFFFMIPVMAAVLRLLYLRRRGTSFTHHAIFSLHIHSFFFSLFLLESINPFAVIDRVLVGALLIVFLIYLVLAMRRAYAVSYGRAILSTLVVTFAYCLVFVITFFLLAVYILKDI